jgi:hypothetical protein
MMDEATVFTKLNNNYMLVNNLITDYFKLLQNYKNTKSFKQKIKQIKTIKKADMLLYNIFNTSSLLLQYSVLKQILGLNVNKNFLENFKKIFNKYKEERNKVFNLKAKAKIFKNKKQKYDPKKIKFSVDFEEKIKRRAAEAVL